MQTFHRGDVVYEEQGVENKVMGAVLGFKTASTRTDTCFVHVQVQRLSLYSFHELLGIVDRLHCHHCSTIAQIRNLDMWTLALKIELSADEIFIQARKEYASLKVTLLTCFQHPQAPEAEHKKVVAVLSNYVTTIQPTRSTRFLIWCFILKG